MYKLYTWIYQWPVLHPCPGCTMGHDPGTRYLFHFNDHLNTDYVHEAPGVTMGPDISDYSQSGP